ncbi:MAG: hypothetical protein RR585_06755, partial [Coprobacillus sp.]
MFSANIDSIFSCLFDLCDSLVILSVIWLYLPFSESIVSIGKLLNTFAFSLLSLNVFSVGISAFTFDVFSLF